MAQIQPPPSVLRLCRGARARVSNSRRSRSGQRLRPRGMAAALLGRRLRRLVRLARQALGTDARAVPDVADALQRFEDSVNMDLPAWRDDRRHKFRPRVVNVEGMTKAFRNKLA